MILPRPDAGLFLPPCTPGSGGERDLAATTIRTEIPTTRHKTNQLVDGGQG